MEITNVEPLVAGTPEPHRGGMNWVFVRVETDAGVTGVGECTWGRYREETLVALIEEVGAKYLTGVSPFQVEKLREKWYRQSHFLHVPGPLQATALAGIEMACWDAVGKAVGEPVYNLLGGLLNDEIPTYTYIYADPDDAADAAAEYVDQGFTGLKIDPIPPARAPRRVSREELNYAARIVGEVREAVGQDVDVMLGTHGQLYTQAAVRLAERVEQYDPLWFEEPVPPENVDEMATVADATSVPVATGERITTKHGFAALLERDAASVLQPNVGLLGLLEAKKVAGMAETHYTEIAPWMYCGPVAGAANLHLAACTPNLLVAEGIERWGGNHAAILEDPIEWADGHATPPSGPGLGVELDDEVVAEWDFNPDRPARDQAAYERDRA